MAPPMADCSGRGIGEDGDAERPPLVFAMAEMERDGYSRVPKARRWCVGWSLQLLAFKGLYRGGVWGGFDV